MAHFSWKKHCIVCILVIYFLSGIIVAIPPHFYIRKYLDLLPLPYSFMAKFNYQGWAMFAPPPLKHQTIKYAAITTHGWGKAQDLFPQMRKQLSESLIFVPSGILRPLNFLRYRRLEDKSDIFPLDQFYYQQLSNYFCYGDGKIPGAIRIRFYVDIRGIPYFYPTTPDGILKRPFDADDGLELIYERDCIKNYENPFN